MFAFILVLELKDFFKRAKCFQHTNLINSPWRCPRPPAPSRTSRCRYGTRPSPSPAAPRKPQRSPSDDRRRARSHRTRQSCCCTGKRELSRHKKLIARRVKISRIRKYVSSPSKFLNYPTCKLWGSVHPAKQPRSSQLRQHHNIIRKWRSTNATLQFSYLLITVNDLYLWSGP